MFKIKIIFYMSILIFLIYSGMVIVVHSNRIKVEEQTECLLVYGRGKLDISFACYDNENNIVLTINNQDQTCGIEEVCFLRDYKDLVNLEYNKNINFLLHKRSVELRKINFDNDNKSDYLLVEYYECAGLSCKRTISIYEVFSNNVKHYIQINDKAFAIWYKGFNDYIVLDSDKKNYLIVYSYNNKCLGGLYKIDLENKLSKLKLYESFIYTIAMVPAVQIIMLLTLLIASALFFWIGPKVENKMKEKRGTG